MNATNMGSVRWGACVWIVLGLTACSGGISIGKDDSKLGGSGGAGTEGGKHGSTGGATAATTDEMGSGGSVNLPDSGSGASTGTGTGTRGNAHGASSGTSACGSSDGWTTLLHVEGTLSPGPLALCVRKVAKTSMVLTALRGDFTGNGTATLYTSAATGPDGPCAGTFPSEGMVAHELVVMTDGHGEVELPSSGALTIRAGEQLTFIVEGIVPTDVGPASATVNAIVSNSGSDGGSGIPVTNPALELDNSDVSYPDGVDIATGNAAACDAPWQALTVAGGTLQPGEEYPFCSRLTLEAPVDIGAIRERTASELAMVRNLTVTYLSPTDPGFSDGNVGCDSLQPNLGGSYVGPFELRFDDGSAPRVPSGYQIVVRGTELNTAPMPYDGTITLEYQASAP